MESGYMVKLFTEVVLIMGLRGYNIQSFKWLIDIHMINDAYIKNGEESKVTQINEKILVEFISNYGKANFGLGVEEYKGERRQFSTCFDNPLTGVRTLVLFGDAINENDSLERTNSMLELVKSMTQYKTSGLSIDPFKSENKVSAIYILSQGISSYSTQIFGALSTTIEIFSDINILMRVYDNCMQSHFTNISSGERNKILSEVHLTPGIIPSMSVEDITCKVLGHRKNTLNLISRIAVSGEELNNQCFIRSVK